MDYFTDQTRKKKYLHNTTNNCPHVIIHYKASQSKIKGCMDTNHFHMITWHTEHPTSTHSFIMLKGLQAMGISEYKMKCQKVYTPKGLARYLTKDPEVRILVAAENITRKGQKAILEMLTERQLQKQDSESDSDRQTHITVKRQYKELNTTSLKKIMKLCNSTDLRNITYCKQSNRQYNKNGTTFCHTPNR